MRGYFGVLVVPVGLAILVSMLSLHKVHEGHVGLYWRGGALLNGMSEPGFHTCVPFVTRHSNVQITLQTDLVKDVPCGTKTGVMIYFDRIEVVNMLRKEKAWDTVKQYGVHYDKTWIFDKVHHEINQVWRGMDEKGGIDRWLQFCSAHSLQEVYIDMFSELDEALAQALQTDCDKYETGIDIVAVRVTKPRIPTTVKKNYEQVEEQNTALRVAAAHQQVVRKREETERVKAEIEAQTTTEVSLITARKEADEAIIAEQKAANVSAIRRDKELAQKEGQQKIAAIKDRIYLEKVKAEAEAHKALAEKEAAANKARITPEYLQSVLYTSLGSNQKIVSGDAIPKVHLGSGDLVW